MLTDVLTSAKDAAKVRHTEGDESYWSADGYGTGDKEHDGQQNKCLLEIGELDFSLHMPGKAPGSPQCGGKAHGEEAEGEDYVPGCHSFEIEVGRSPEIILLQEVSAGGIGHYDGAKRAYEGSEKDTEGDEILRIYPQGDEKADERTDKGADKAADCQ